jgi:hypothetical protein
LYSSAAIVKLNQRSLDLLNPSFKSYSEVKSEELRLAKSKLQSTNVNDGEPKLVPQKLRELELEKEFVVQYLQ